MSFHLPFITIISLFLDHVLHNHRRFCIELRLDNSFKKNKKRLGNIIAEVYCCYCGSKWRFYLNNYKIWSIEYPIAVINQPANRKIKTVNDGEILQIVNCMVDSIGGRKKISDLDFSSWCSSYFCCTRFQKLPANMSNHYAGPWS